MDAEKTSGDPFWFFLSKKNMICTVDVNFVRMVARSQKYVVAPTPVVYPAHTL